MRTEQPSNPGAPGPDLAAPFVAELLERISDGFVAYDRSWRLVYMNAAAEQFWGRAREALLGRVVWEAMPEVLGTETERALRAAAAGAGVTEFELRSAVVPRWTAVRAYPSESGLAIYFRDVTAQKQAELALRESEARFRALFDYALEGICLTRPNGEILSANPAACAMFDRTEAELRSLGRGAVVDLADPRVARFIEARRRDGHARSEHDALRADGTRFPIEVSSVLFRDAAGEELTAMTFHDLTERRRAEAALQLLAQASDLLSTSLDYRATVERLVHLAVPRLADLAFVDLLEPEGLVRIAAAHREPTRVAALQGVRHDPALRADAGVLKVLHTGEVELVPEIDAAWLERAVPLEHHRATIAGLGPRSALMVPLRAEGRILGVLSLVHDRAHRQFVADDVPLAQSLADRAALAIRNAQLFRQAMEAKQLREEMLGIVSHDLRTPLNTIAIVARVLQKRGLEGPELQAIRAAVQSADRLIHDLLAATQADSGRMQLERAPCAPAELVAEAARSHRALAESRGLELVEQVEAELPLLAVDRFRVGQLLGNLVTNAIKFTPTGGAVTLLARAAPGGVELGVRDTGPGIPEAHLARLFDRFWQGAQARQAGAGLGLSIVKGIAEAHGATVRVESQVGRGATFSVFFPASAG